MLQRLHSILRRARFTWSAGSTGFECLAVRLRREDEELPSNSRGIQRDVLDVIESLDISIAGLHTRISRWHKDCEESRRLEGIP